MAVARARVPILTLVTAFLFTFFTHVFHLPHLMILLYYGLIVMSTVFPYFFKKTLNFFGFYRIIYLILRRRGNECTW